MFAAPGFRSEPGAQAAKAVTVERQQRGDSQAKEQEESKMRFHAPNLTT